MSNYNHIEVLNELNELKKYRELGTIEELSKRVKEEDILKFYYCDSEDEYYVGQRLDTMYYARVRQNNNGEICLTFEKSRYLPWGEHVVAPNTSLKEYTYPSEPKEIPFEKWLKGWLLKQKEEIKTDDENDLHEVCENCRRWTCLECPYADI